MKYAYVTVLTTNNYFQGTLVTLESLKRTNPKIKEFVVLVNEEIEESNIQILNSFNYKVIKINKIELDSNTNYQNMKHWKNTFDKLKIFELTDYDKIIYLDSDLQILQNIDELFQLPHLSGVIAGKSAHPEWTGINSGLIVIEPKEKELQRIIEGLKDFNTEEEFGDQDIINYYYHWAERNLSIPEKYNIFSREVDYYINHNIVKEEDIHIIHYIGLIKPWMIENREEVLSDYKNKGLNYQAKYLENYFQLLEEIRSKL